MVQKAAEPEELSSFSRHCPAAGGWTSGQGDHVSDRRHRRRFCAVENPKTAGGVHPVGTPPFLRKRLTSSLRRYGGDAASLSRIDQAYPERDWAAAATATEIRQNGRSE